MTTRRQPRNKKKVNKVGAQLADSLYDPVVLALANNMFSCTDCQAPNQDKIDTTTYDSKKATIMMGDMANKRAESAANDALCDLIPIPWEHMANAKDTADKSEFGKQLTPSLLSSSTTVYSSRMPKASKRAGGNSAEQNQALLAAQGISTARAFTVGDAVPTVLTPPCQRAVQQGMTTSTALQLVIRPDTFEDNHRGEEKEGSIGPIQDNYRSTTQAVSVVAIHTQQQQQQQQVLDLFGSDLKAAADNVYQGVLSIASCYECVHPHLGKVGGNIIRARVRSGGEEKCSSNGMGSIQPCHTSSSSTAEPLPSLQGGYSV
jgi:hypothetical protein